MNFDDSARIVTLTKAEHKRFKLDSEWRMKIMERIVNHADVRGSEATWSIYADDCDDQIAHANCELSPDAEIGSYIDESTDDYEE